MGSKSEMLAAIRAALSGASGHGGGHTEPVVPAMPSADTQQQELVNQFCAELEKVGGHVAHIRSFEQLRDYIDDRLSQAHTAEPAQEESASSVPDPPGIAVSDGVHRLLPALRTWLESRGFAPVPSLRESDSIDAPQYKRTLFTSAMGVTTADFAIADTGTLVLVSERNPQSSSNTGPDGAGNGGDQHRLMSLVPPIHICLLNANRILANLSELITHVNGMYYRGAEPPLAMTFITGPSRTADIELTLTMGVHGPRELHVLLYDSTLHN